MVRDIQDGQISREGGVEMPKKRYMLELTKDELLTLREAIAQIDNHSDWIVDAMENEELLPGIYKKVYELANPVIEEMYGVNLADRGDQ